MRDVISATNASLAPPVHRNSVRGCTSEDPTIPEAGELASQALKSRAPEKSYNAGMVAGFSTLHQTICRSVENCGPQFDLSVAVQVSGGMRGSLQEMMSLTSLPSRVHEVH
jgi:hypothetical protein